MPPTACEVFRGNLSFNTEDLGTLPRALGLAGAGRQASGQGAWTGPLDDLALRRLVTA